MRIIKIEEEERNRQVNPHTNTHTHMYSHLPRAFFFFYFIQFDMLSAMKPRPKPFSPREKFKYLLLLLGFFFYLFSPFGFLILLFFQLHAFLSMIAWFGANGSFALHCVCLLQTHSFGYLICMRLCCALRLSILLQQFRGLCGMCACGNKTKK